MEGIELKKVLGDIYPEYDLSDIEDHIVYKSKDKVKIKCPNNHTSIRTVSDHKKGRKCNSCKDTKTIDKYKGEFIDKAMLIHEGKYGYDKVDYINSNTEVIITCNIHGDFKQLPRNHIQGMGCKECGNINMDVESIINKIHSIIGKSKLNLLYNINTKGDNIIITYFNSMCVLINKYVLIKNLSLLSILGSASYQLYFFLYNKGILNLYSILDNMNIDDFNMTIKSLGRIYYPEYTYIPSIINDKMNLEYICSIHGINKQSFINHFEYRYKCNECSKIKDPIYLLLNKLGIKFNYRCNELDFYVPEKNLAIEVNGNRWHSECIIPAPRSHTHMKNKTILCREKNINLLHFYEDEIKFKLPIVSSMIKHRLNLTSNIIYGRNTEIYIIDDINIINKFLDDNHIQGSIPYVKDAYGLYYNDELVSLMTFNYLSSVKGKKKDSSIIELTRFCNKIDFNIVGGASKLLKAYIEDNPNLKEIISYSDNRISSGGIYSTLGFTKGVESRPSYYYVAEKDKFLIRYHKSAFRKDRIRTKYKEVYDEELTEVEMMRKLNYYRLFDVGKIKWTLEL